MLYDFFITPKAIEHLKTFIENNCEVQAKLADLIEHCAAQTLVPYEQWQLLLETLDAELDEPALGIKIGDQFRVEHCGVLGYLFRTSRNVLEALNCYQRFERLIYSGNNANFVIENERMHLRWDHGTGSSNLISDAMLLAAITNIIREILNDESISPQGLAFPQVIAPNILPYYSAYFKCQPRTGHERLEISFKLADLKREIPFCDQILHSLLDQQAQTLMSELPPSNPFVHSLNRAIVSTLNEGKADAESVAKQLGLSSRSLHRKLKEGGYLYRTVLQTVRLSLAKRYLKDDIELSQVALLLGYSEQSAFTRAFKTWMNCSPKAYKAKLKCST